MHHWRYLPSTSTGSHSSAFAIYSLRNPPSVMIQNFEFRVQSCLYHKTYPALYTLHSVLNEKSADRIFHRPRCLDRVLWFSQYVLLHNLSFVWLFSGPQYCLAKPLIWSRFFFHRSFLQVLLTRILSYLSWFYWVFSPYGILIN